MKKLVRPVQKVKAGAVGLDVHRATIVFTWMDRHGDEVEQGRIEGSATALRGLIERIPSPLHVAFEAGRSTFRVPDLLVSIVGEEAVHVAQPKKIRAIANSTEKNDFNDSWWLAFLTHEGRLPECHVPTGTMRKLRLAARERFDLVKLITHVKVRLRAQLRQMGVRTPNRKIDSMRTWNELLELATARDDVPGRAIGGHLLLLEHLIEARKGWEETIAALTEDVPEVRTIEQEVPGVGPVLAAVLVAEWAPIRRFSSPKALARYTGPTPSDRSSAGRLQRGSITREGSEHLRWALTQAVMACTRARNGPGVAVAKWIRAKERRMGCKGKARVAAARKLAESIWRLFHLGECFDAARPFGGMPVATM